MQAAASKMDEIQKYKLYTGECYGKMCTVCTPPPPFPLANNKPE